MKMQSLLGLCLSGCLLLAGSAAMADNNDKSNNRSARAVQVHIDKETGKKTAPDDSDAGLSAAAAAPVTAADATVIMPLENQEPVHNADGTVSARLGVKSMKFMTMTIGEDGEKVVTHETVEEFTNKTELKSVDKGLE